MNLMAKIKERLSYLNEQEEQAKQEGRLVGRFIREQIADGYAHYVIKEIDGDRAFIEHYEVSGDYKHNYFGDARWIDLSYVEQQVQQRDKVEEIFGD